MKFTEKIAEYIDEQSLDTRRLTIILPSERAVKFISAALFKRNGGPLIAPEMITVDRWIRKLSDKTVVDRTRLLVKLFQVQMEDPADPKDAIFDEFLSWGQILLSDFDEIDRYMLDHEMVFRNLADIREIENWSFNSTEPTEAQRRFMQFWERLPKYYNRLNEILDEEGLCYMGKAYRYLAENIGRAFETDKERKFIFAGFNALSEAELKIIKQLHQLGRAHVLIDADRYYLDDPVHEAGMFLRHLKAELGVKELPFELNELAVSKKDVTVIECVQQTGQVKSCATLLSELSHHELNETLVLMADESLIVPMMKNIPSSVGQANITLGMPLKNTAIRTWVDMIFGFQESRERFSTKALYFQDLQRFWNHPFVTAFLNEEEHARILDLEALALRKNMIFRNRDSVKVSARMDQLLDTISLDWNGNWITAMDAVIGSLNCLRDMIPESREYDLAVIQGFDDAIIDFTNIVREGLPQMSLRSFRALLQQHWSNKSVAYHGNPIKGLQIMGLLETRLLDFKNIIVLGLNEGKMPPTNPIQTLIPMDLRAWLKLPTTREKQALFAHHFYRLLHQCERMWVTYSSARENIGSNEASRYLLQLQYELSRTNQDLSVNKLLYSIPEDQALIHKTPSIVKDPEVLDKISGILSVSVSASMINKYLQCPLDFYYRYVLEFGEEDDFEEDVEFSTFGTFIHAVLEELYKPFCRHDKQGNLISPAPRAITSYDVDEMLGKYEGLVRTQFMKKFNQEEKAFMNGKNLLSFKMALELTKKYLDEEKKFLMEQKEPVFIEYLEFEIKVPVKLIVRGIERQIILKGYIDRIDSIGGKMRIIDYKTGKIEQKDVAMKLDPLDLRKSFSGTKHAVQMAMYGVLFKEKFGELPAEIALCSFLRLKDGLFKLSVSGDQNSLGTITNHYADFLSELFSEMLDPELNVEHTPGWNSYCTYCE
jgi:RecB family exonuclease